MSIPTVFRRGKLNPTPSRAASLLPTHANPALTMPTAAEYIAQSKARTTAKYAETNRLLAVWQDAYRLWAVQPCNEFKDLMQHAYAAYKAEQNRVLSLTN